jgi:hypothetical protein
VDISSHNTKMIMKWIIVLLLFTSVNVFAQNGIKEFLNTKPTSILVHSKKEAVMEVIEDYIKTKQSYFRIYHLSIEEIESERDYYAKSLSSSGPLLVDSILCDCIPMKKYGTKSTERLWVQKNISKIELKDHYGTETTVNFTFEERKGVTLVRFFIYGFNSTIESYQDGPVRCFYTIPMKELKSLLKKTFKTSEEK